MIAPFIYPFSSHTPPSRYTHKKPPTLSETCATSLRPMGGGGTDFSEVVEKKKKKKKGGLGFFSLFKRFGMENDRLPLFSLCE